MLENSPHCNASPIVVGKPVLLTGYHGRCALVRPEIGPKKTPVSGPNTTSFQAFSLSSISRFNISLNSPSKFSFVSVPQATAFPQKRIVISILKFTKTSSLSPPGGPDQAANECKHSGAPTLCIPSLPPPQPHFRPSNPSYCLHLPPRNFRCDSSPLPGTGAASRDLSLWGPDIHRARAVEDGVAAVDALEGAGCVIVGTDVGDAEGILCYKVRPGALHQ